MARGLPDAPPEDIAHRFVDAGPDDTCPECGWDPDDDMQDQPKAHAEGRLYAIEQADGAIFSAMGGASALCYYWRCPNGFVANNGNDRVPCETHFTVEVEDAYLGGMN